MIKVDLINGFEYPLNVLTPDGEIFTVLKHASNVEHYFMQQGICPHEYPALVADENNVTVPWPLLVDIHRMVTHEGYMTIDRAEDFADGN